MFRIFALAAFVLVIAAPGEAPPNRTSTYTVVKPGTHPGIIFSEEELPALRLRAGSTGLAGEAWRRVRENAGNNYSAALSVEQLVGADGERLAQHLESMALVYQIERDTAVGRKAAELFLAVTATDPRDFYRTVADDFFATEHWPKAFAFAWDWLYPVMTEGERASALRHLEQWSAALFEHTENAWWADASYNCGAIPVGAHGLLLTAIQAESKHPQFRHWFDTCFRKVKYNYFPGTWRANGICNEGPGYAHYHKNPTQFADAVRRTGGEDIIAGSGAVNAMHYLRHQWMPQGRCATVGDNTEYGRRVFQAIYLFGIRELDDRPGLWTFEKYGDREHTEPTLLFLYYPDGLSPASPGELDLLNSYYFEIDANRAGYLFSRSRWDDEQASWFAFTTRYAEANHTHYDMNSFVFTAFGEEFAAHWNIYSYGSQLHGADLEHNIVIVDGGGMPVADRSSAGDDGSINGFLTGVATGNFADYARGDARLSYADRSVPGDAPALRANRAVVFVKQGPNPYIVAADDIRKDDAPHDYHWQWYTRAPAVSGRGDFAQPFSFELESVRGAIAFWDPETPEHEFRLVKGEGRRAPELGLLRVNRRAVETHFVALAAAWRKDAAAPVLRRGPAVEGHADAAALVVEGGGFRDLIVWQPEQAGDKGRQIAAGPLRTDALIAVVRIDAAGAIVGYLMGDGTSLQFDGRPLVHSAQRLSVSADGKRSIATGPRRARQELEPLAAAGSFWLPSTSSEVWVENRRVNVRGDTAGMVTLPETGSR